MKLTLINGSLKERHGHFDKLLGQFRERLLQSSEVENLDDYILNKMNIKQCVGCFQCWTKTPGRCVIKDDAERILISVINSDWVIFASPLVMGMTTGLLKRLNDRLIPLIHPYFSVVQGEIHHRKRYESYPKMGVVYEPALEDTQEDINLCHEIYDRLAINFKTSLEFFKPIEAVKGGIRL